MVLTVIDLMNFERSAPSRGSSVVFVNGKGESRVLFCFLQSTIRFTVSLYRTSLSHTFTHSQSDQKGSCSSTLGDVSRIGVGEKLERSWSGFGLGLGSAELGLGTGFG